MASLDTLKTTIKGSVVTPQDNEYSAAKDGFMQEGHPLAVIKVQDHNDVAATIAFAKEQGLLLSVRSGGHSIYSTNNGGVVLDLSNINTIERTGDTTVRVGAGATWVEVAEQLHEWNLAISSGDSTSVGVGGLTTGGGIGWMVRKYGITIDNLLAADIITADGMLRHLSATENEDLFWAIRGGGGNFGVVTHFEFKAHENYGVFSGSVTYDRDDAKSILTKWRDYMRRAPEELSVIINILPAFGEAKPTFMLSFCYAGTDETTAMEAITPLFSLGRVVDKKVQQMPYKDILEVAHGHKGSRVIVNNMIINDFTDEAIATIAREGLEHDLVLQIRSLGGAMNRVEKGATAFAHRRAEVVVVQPFFPSPSATKEEIEKNLAPWYTLSTFSNGSYINLLNEPTEQAEKAAYPAETLERLQAIKAAYDPNNLFNQNHNITPEKNNDA